jgi:hypothetical protein
MAATAATLPKIYAAFDFDKSNKFGGGGGSCAIRSLSFYTSY